MKKKKLLKTLGISTLAFGACAVMSLSVVLPALVANPKIETQELTQASPLNLDPETDEIIAYTKGGIPIRSHNVKGVDSISYQYITLGSYNGTPVNWLVVAVNTEGMAENITPAGIAINNETDVDCFCGKVEDLGGYGRIKLFSECVFVDDDGFFFVDIPAHDSVTGDASNSGNMLMASSCPKIHLEESNYYSTLSYSYLQDIINSFQGFSANGVKSITIPSSHEYTTYLPSAALLTAKEFGKNTTTYYQVGSGTIVGDFSIDSSLVQAKTGNVTYGYEGTSTGTFSNLTGVGFDLSGTLSNVQMKANGCFTANLSYVNTSGYYFKTTMTIVSSFKIFFTNIRPMMIVDITEL